MGPLAKPQNDILLEEDANLLPVMQAWGEFGLIVREIVGSWGCGEEKVKIEGLKSLNFNCPRCNVVPSTVL